MLFGLHQFVDLGQLAENRARRLPMIDFVASIARYQQNQGLYFILENYQTSKIWTLKSIMELMKHAQVTWHDLNFAFGLCDPDTKLRSETSKPHA